MTLFWAIILVGYGVIAGFNAIHPLFWWLLVVMLLQDWYDTRHKR